MRILLVDDNPRRYQALINEYVERGGRRENIDLVSNAMEARVKLSGSPYDLMVLDIVIPLRAEDEPDASVSRDLVDELLESDLLIRPKQIVGLSGFAKVAEEVAPRFLERLWTVIRYSEDNDEWIEQVLNCVDYLASTQTEVKKHADVVVLCALGSPELAAVLRLPWNWSTSKPISDTLFVHYGSFNIDGKAFTVAATSSTRMGMVSAAVIATNLIHILKPKLVAMTGICAGVKGRTNIGDVILADPTWDYGSGKRTLDGEIQVFAQSPHQISTSPKIRSRIEQIASDSSLLLKIESLWPRRAASRLRLLIGPVASGAAVLADARSISEIRQQHRELCGIEMEGYGVCSACQLSTPYPLSLILKGVCDFADNDKNDEFQDYAAYTSAQVLQAFLERFGLEIL